MEPSRCGAFMEEACCWDQALSVYGFVPLPILLSAYAGLRSDLRFQFQPAAAMSSLLLQTLPPEP